MINSRQSFLVSFAVHAVILIAIFVVGIIIARRALRPRTTIELDLLAPVQADSEDTHGAEEMTAEREPEIVEREIPSFNPEGIFDPSKIPDVKEEKYDPWKPRSVEAEDVPGGAAGTNYAGLVAGVCKKNWTPPPPGVLGQPVPKTVVMIRIQRDGRILSHRIVGPSGHAELDRSVSEAIKLSDPLPAFPRELTGAELELRIRFTPQE